MTATSDTGKTKNSSTTFTHKSKLLTNEDEGKHKSEKAHIKSQPTLTPNKGQKPFHQPVTTRSIPGVSTMTDVDHQ